MDNLVKNVLLTPFNLLYKINPALELKLMFKLKQGYDLNLKKPITYDEKIQWIKLYDKNPLMPKCCDKYTAREFVRYQGCEEILNPLLWSGFNPTDIPFDDLPSKYVIKVTHGSTFNIIVTDATLVDREDVISKCNKWLKAKFLVAYGEWFYGVEKPRIIVENYIESVDGESLKDYKIYCFHGKPSYVAVHSDRFSNHQKDLYDVQWNYLKGKYIGYPSSGKIIEKPVVWDKVLEYAEKLSKPFNHARVDFYIEGEQIIFGEITFTPGAGFDKFCSYDFDKEFGQNLIIPDNPGGVTLHNRINDIYIFNDLQCCSEAA